jgi:hypothetical protein
MKIYEELTEEERIKIDEAWEILKVLSAKDALYIIGKAIEIVDKEGVIE